jgi:hypothetical protein
MPLSSATAEAFRILVTRKLEAGWTYANDSPVVKPLIHETQLALPPSYDVTPPSFTGLRTGTLELTTQIPGLVEEPTAPRNPKKSK